MKPPFPRPATSDAAAPAPPFNQQGFQSGVPLGNACNMLQNPMPAQAQMGMFNPRLPFPLGAPNVPGMVYQAGLMNTLAGIFSSQNNLMGMPQFNSGVGFSQSGPSTLGGVGPQLGLPNMFPWQPCNQTQNSDQPNQTQVPQGQLFPNLLNLPQQLSQNMGLLNPILNMSPHFPMHSPSPPFFPGAVSNGQLACLNTNFLANPLSALLQSNQMQQQVNQSQQNLTHAGVLDSSITAASQGNTTKSAQIMRNPPVKQVGMKTSPQRFQKSQYPTWGSGKRKFGFSNVHQGKGPRNKFLRTNFPNLDNGNKRSQNFHHVNMKRNGPFNDQKRKVSGNGMATEFAATNSEDIRYEKRRSLTVTYTEKEIKEWREERKRNYPSKANVEKKLSGKDPEVTKLLSKQLKEILAKQAELGVEVAEIPSSYLSRSEKTVHVREESGRSLRKMGRFAKKQHDRRRRYDKREQLGKKQNPSGSGLSHSKRSPSLLEKLLSVDIKKDKMALLQIFRFMVGNSFFSSWPENPLQFPQVVVKESALHGEVVEEKSSQAGNDQNNGRDNEGDENDNGDHDDDKQFMQRRELIYGGRSKIEGKAKTKLYDEEEGEIID